MDFIIVCVNCQAVKLDIDIILIRKGQIQGTSKAKENTVASLIMGY